MKRVQVDTISREKFAVEISKVMRGLASSHCYFILQQAFGETMDWSDCEKLFDKMIGQKRKIN
jgi:hypothetical protein